MFERFTYLGYTLIFCVPLVSALWGRTNFARELRRDLTGILLSTAAITAYGSLLWPLAMRWNCWSYAESKILNYRLLNYVFVEDVIWWGLVSFLVSSFVALATRSGEDIVLRELLGLTRRLRRNPSD